ncbi:Sporulation-specific [Hyphodiscus hymeniophilus]|uniref:2,4-dienoyl-CoA reductase [(3E)-enoyl-CoA-producing] n=1 Tax=Hyphodiscus hymeniophilus TaxID=353542 RepID=A0A9P6SQT1_9HELO|nr:Sporulation-specific [Hyphodiscus hymeniophilus]
MSFLLSSEQSTLLYRRSGVDLFSPSANACIIGRSKGSTESAAEEIANVRPGAKILGIGGTDVRKAEDLQRAAEKCVEVLGSIDFVIAGAAGNFLAPIDQLSSNAFKSVIDIDVLGSYNTLKATIPYLVQSAAKSKAQPSKFGTGGRIIFAHVSAAKSGVDSLSNVVALEYGPRGVTSNVISPGPIGGTEGVARLLRDDPTSRESHTKQIPLGHYGSVKNIADATVYLFADSGSFVSGTNVIVDGAAWRVGAANPGFDFTYPDFLLSGETISGVQGTKKSKL